MTKNLLLLLAIAAFAGCSTGHMQASNAADGSRVPAGAGLAEPKNGRDGIKYYAEGGKFYFQLPNVPAGRPCTITEGIKDFRMISRGSNVLAYETSTGDLVMLRSGDANATQCYSLKPLKTTVTDQQAPVVKWNVINAADQAAVMIALDRNGFVKMYDAAGNDLSKLGIKNVQDYRLHPCFGKKGVPFNSKIAFGWGANRVGTITPDGKFVLDAGNYASAEDFIARNNINCAN